MYQADDEEVFVIDGHTHFWDASPENWRNKYGKGWIRCFYDYHTALSPKEYVWPFEKYCKYGEQTMIQDQCCPGKVAPSDGKSRPLNVLWPVLPGNDLKSRGRKWSPERSIRTRHNEG